MPEPIQGLSEKLSPFKFKSAKKYCSNLTVLTAWNQRSAKIQGLVHVGN